MLLEQASLGQTEVGGNRLFRNFGSYQTTPRYITKDCGFDKYRSHLPVSTCKLTFY